MWYLVDAFDYYGKNLKRAVRRYRRRRTRRRELATAELSRVDRCIFDRNLRKNERERLAYDFLSMNDREQRAHRHKLLLAGFNEILITTIFIGCLGISTMLGALLILPADLATRIGLAMAFLTPPLIMMSISSVFLTSWCLDRDIRHINTRLQKELRKITHSK